MKGDAYEGLLEKNAEDIKTRRGPVLHAAPADPGDRRRDAPDARPDDLRPGLRHRRLPARRARLHRTTSTASTATRSEHLRVEALRGWEIVDNTARLCAMNLLCTASARQETQPDPRSTTPAQPTPATTSTWC